MALLIILLYTARRKISICICVFDDLPKDMGSNNLEVERSSQWTDFVHLLCDDFWCYGVGSYKLYPKNIGVGTMTMS